MPPTHLSLYTLSRIHTSTCSLNLLLTHSLTRFAAPPPHSLSLSPSPHLPSYLPEFRALRKQHDFFTICRNPELACEVSLQPLARFPTLDAIIIFCDILVIPQAMGMEVQMVPGKGPVFPDPIVTPADLDKLVFKPDVEESLGYMFDALNLTRSKIDGRVPLIGFVGAPWTLMAYMIEGQGSKTFSKAKGWLYTYPEASHRLLSAITDLLVEFLIAQHAAGAQLLQVFDSWAGYLAPDTFRTFGLPYISQIATRVKAAIPGVPMTVFAKGAHYALGDLGKTDFDTVSLDWTQDPAEARVAVGNGKTLQGNLDPCALYGTPEMIAEKVRRPFTAGYLCIFVHLALCACDVMCVSCVCRLCGGDCVAHYQMRTCFIRRFFYLTSFRYGRLRPW